MNFKFTVAYDARTLSIPYTGLGRFSAKLLFALLKCSKKYGIFYNVILFGSEQDNKLYINDLLEYEKVGLCSIVYINSRPVSLSQHVKLSLLVNSLSPDIYFHTHFDLPLFVKSRSITVVHDLFPLLVDGYMVKYARLKKFYFSAVLNFMVRKSSVIYAVSNTTKQDLIDFLGYKFSKKIRVCNEGPIIASEIAHVSPESRIGSSRYLLYVGDRRPHKNLKRIIDIFIGLRNSGLYDGRLLIVGSKKNYDFNVEEYVASRKDIVFLGNVDDQELMKLYKNMDALIFLSKYEGFGLPVLEAAMLGKKIITSDGGALKEVAPKWAHVVKNYLSIDQSLLLAIANYLNADVKIELASYGAEYNWNLIGESISSDIASLN